jgi:hypothetical protein
MPQTPPVQVGCPFGTPPQPALQLPQLAGSLESVTHLPPHSVWLTGQVSVQTDATQTSPAPHWMPQPPQWLALVLVSTQLLPHLTKPLRQVKPHAPELQVAVPFAGTLHDVPQPPQFETSLVVSMQLEPHLS